MLTPRLAASLNKGHCYLTRNGVEMARFGSDKADTIGLERGLRHRRSTTLRFPPKASGGGTAWRLVARGYTGAYEQVLLDDAGQPPWLLSPIAAFGA